MSQIKRKYIKLLDIQSKAPNTPKTPKLPLSPSICTLPFYDELPKGNHESSSKGGGGGDRRALTKSTHKP